MTTEADRLAAAGIPLEIAGQTFHVRYTPRAMKLMEDRYGNLKRVGEELQALGDGEHKLYDPIFWLLAVGLRHEIDGESQQRIDEDWLLDNASSKRLNEYAEVAFAALVEALPTATAESLDPTKGTTESPGASNGVSTSGSRSRSLASARRSSGTD